jgi:hypothetical protein
VYFDSRFADITDWIELARFAKEEDGGSVRWRKKAAFNLHHAVETAYACLLLARSFYFPRSHKIRFLRSLAEDQDKRLIEAGPRDTRADRRRFELLKREPMSRRAIPIPLHQQLIQRSRTGPIFGKGCVVRQ